MNTITFFIPRKLKKDFKLKVLQDNTDMTKILIELIEKYVKG